MPETELTMLGSDRPSSNNYTRTGMDGGRTSLCSALERATATQPKRWPEWSALRRSLALASHRSRFPTKKRRLCMRTHYTYTIHNFRVHYHNTLPTKLYVHCSRRLRTRKCVRIITNMMIMLYTTWWYETCNLAVIMLLLPSVMVFSLRSVRWIHNASSRCCAHRTQLRMK